MKIFLLLIALILVIGLGLGLYIYFAFNAEDHSQYDESPTSYLMHQNQPSKAHQDLAALIKSELENAPKLSFKDQIAKMRKDADARGEHYEFEGEIRPLTIEENLNAEWIIAKGADKDNRLLYVHGGAYMTGSSKSHRPITARLSRAANAAVLAVDYRLLPEHSRKDGLDDILHAYQWMLKNGVNGAQDATKIMIAGDSSGGNMALSLLQTIRDFGLKQADQAIIFSPQTDLTLQSPSLINNIETDVMQGSSFGPIVKAPNIIKLGFMYMMHKENPSNPRFSPLLGNLTNLPPTLMQASSGEMFLDDAVRYKNKAKAAGSMVELQIWPELMHVWQAFDVPEAEEAYQAIEAFTGAKP